MAALCSLAALSTLALLPVSASVTRIVERAGRPLLLFDSLFGKKEAAPDEDGLALAQKLGLQLPQFEVLAKQDGFEVRRYQRLAVVECEYEKRPEGYELLGGYCAGETEAGLPMPKTAPCVMRPTAKPKTMWYILPNPHTPLDPEDEPVPPPAPIYSALTLRDIPPLVVGVGRFSGYAVPDVVLGRAAQLRSSLEAAGYNLVDVEGGPEAALMLAQYNELFALPWNRDNEVWYQVELPAVASE